MSIPSLTGMSLPTLAAARAESASSAARESAPPDPATAAVDAEESRSGQKSRIEALQSLVHQARLEVRFEMLPDTNISLIRIVEPETGEVIREFPPEGLARALAELRESAASRLDRKA